jgi:lauroyl/myristoyl acyltransferase
MNARMKRYRHGLEYAGVRVALLLVSLLPLRIACAVGAAIGWLAYTVFGVRRRVSTENVRRAVGESSVHGSASSIARRSY